MPEDDRDLTTDDVAQALQLNRATVQRLLLAGRLRGYQIGRSWRVPRTALEEFRHGVRERAAVSYGRPPGSSRMITDRKEWLKAFKALGGSIAVRPPSADSLRREALYEDRT